MRKFTKGITGTNLGFLNSNRKAKYEYSNTNGFEECETDDQAIISELQAKGFTES